MDFDAALLAVQNNAADMMLAGLSYSEERDEVVDFSDSYATGVQVVIVKEGSDVTMDNLGDYMIGTQRGTTGYLYASDTPENGGYGEDHVIGYDNGATAVQELINGTIDAVIIDNAARRGVCGRQRRRRPDHPGRRLGGGGLLRSPWTRATPPCWTPSTPP